MRRWQKYSQELPSIFVDHLYQNKGGEDQFIKFHWMNMNKFWHSFSCFYSLLYHQVSLKCVQIDWNDNFKIGTNSFTFWLISNKNWFLNKFSNFTPMLHLCYPFAHQNCGTDHKYLFSISLILISVATAFVCPTREEPLHGKPVNRPLSSSLIFKKNKASKKCVCQKLILIL